MGKEVLEKHEELRQGTHRGFIIEGIKTGFREAINGLTKVGDHIRQAMREQKSGEKEIQGIRQTLRTLQSVRI